MDHTVFMCVSLGIIIAIPILTVLVLEISNKLYDRKMKNQRNKRGQQWKRINVN